MKELKELLSLVDRGEYNDYQEQLVSMVLDGLDRKEAREKWEKADKSESHFRKVYKSVKDDAVARFIIDSLDLIEDAKQSRAKMWRNFVSVKLLMMLRKRSSAKLLAIECFNLAKHCGVSEAAFHMAAHLRYHFARIESDSAKYSKYKFEARNSKYNIEIEDLADEIHGEVIHLYNKRKDLEFIKPQILSLSAFVSDSPYFHLHQMSARLSWERLTGRNEKALQTCRAALTYFSQMKNDTLPYVINWNFGRQLAMELLRDGNYIESEARFRQVFKVGRGGIKRGGLNYHVGLMLQSRIGFFSKKIGMAEAAFKKARRFKTDFQNELIEEEWRQVEAWIVIYRLYKKEKNVPKFRISSYLNNVPHEFREKKHSNVQVRIIELMYHLLNGNKERFMEITFNIPSYIRNNLKGKKYLRQRLILESIGKIDENRYVKERVEKSCSKNIIKMSSIPVNVESEWIPFERVWEMALSVLK